MASLLGGHFPPDGGQALGDTYNAVVLVDVDQPGPVRAGGVLFDFPVGEDDNQVALVDQAGGGAVDDDLSGAAGPLDGVGGEASAVVYVEDVDLLVGED